MKHITMGKAFPSLALRSSLPLLAGHIPATPLVITLLLAILFSGCSKKTKTASESAVPKSIVALSPSAAEILFAVGAGDQVAAVSDFTDYPPEATEKPVVGGFDGKTLSMENILSYKPDLVYLTDVMHNYMIEQLDSYGIKYYLSTANSITSVEKEITDIGQITGHSEQAKNIVAQMEKKLAGVKGNYPAGGAPKLYYEVWNVPYMSAGEQSFINEIISAAGAQNIFSDVNDAYPIVSEESIITRQPEIIIIPASSGVTAADVKERAGWQSIPAVQNNKIFIVDDNIYNRPGPRIADVVEELSELIK